MKKRMTIVLLLVLAALLIFSLWKVIALVKDYWAGEQFYIKIAQHAQIPETTESAADPEEPKEDPEQETEPEEAVLVWPEVDFDELKKINSDVVGWIYIPDTKINYPVLQGSTNDEYIYHLMTGIYNRSGSIFLEAGVPSDFSGKNNVLYGHSMHNGTMFSDVLKYVDRDFYAKHPVGMLLTPEKNYYVRFYSGYVTDVWSDAWDTGFSEDTFSNWLRNTGRKSYFVADVSPTTQDRVLTLSTCSFETEESRFVLHGVLEEYIPESENTAG